MVNMTTKTFKQKLGKLIEQVSGEFVVDNIEMDEIRETAIKQGFDDILCIAGKDHNEIFTLSIQKI